MLTVTQMVCRKCPRVYSITVGAICPQCHSNLNMVTFVEESAQQSAQADGAKAPEHTGTPYTCEHPDCKKWWGDRPAAKA